MIDVLDRETRAYLDFIVTGTMFRYTMANQRYAGFFLFPILSVVLFAVVGWLAAHLLTAFLGLEGMSAAAVGLAAGVAVFLVLLRWPGRRWRVQQLLDDWICAHDYIHGRRPDIDARLDRFAETLLARARARWTKSWSSATPSAQCLCSMFVSARLRAPAAAFCGAIRRVALAVPSHAQGAWPQLVGDWKYATGTLR